MWKLLHPGLQLLSRASRASTYEAVDLESADPVEASSKVLGLMWVELEPLPTVPVQLTMVLEQLTQKDGKVC